MTALTLFIIRHGEKPEGSDPGLDDDGNPDRASLTLRGWQRAGAWAALFGAGLGSDSYPAPAILYAADPTRSLSGKISRRQVETVEPLAARLGLSPVTRFAKGEEGALAAELGTLAGVVLVCWEHALIVETLLPALLGGGEGVPLAWDKARFDVVLRLDRPAPDAPWTFRQLFPRLLAGDSDAPLA